MSGILLLFSFILGTCIGSFVGVIIYRSLHGMSPYKGRSVCDNCKRQLRWFENIPLFSYLALRGQCRSCKKKIDWTYPLIEFVTGLLFLWWAGLGFAFFQLSQAPLLYIQPLYWLVIGILLVVVFFVDFKYGIIPDYTVVLLTLAAVGYRSILVLSHVMRPIDFIYAVISGLLSAGFFLALFLGTKGRGIGFGDVKFAIPMGIILGFPKVVVGFYVSFILGGIFGIFLLVSKKKKFGQTVPFGPFLILGLLTALVFGQEIWTWYLTLLRV